MAGGWGFTDYPCNGPCNNSLYFFYMRHYYWQGLDTSMMGLCKRKEYITGMYYCGQSYGNVFVFLWWKPRICESNWALYVLFLWKVIWAPRWCLNSPHCLPISAHNISAPLQLSAPWQQLALLSGCSEDSACERAVFFTHPMFCSLW